MKFGRVRCLEDPLPPHFRAPKELNAYAYVANNPLLFTELPSTPTANLLTGLGLDEVLTRTDAAGLRAFLADALGSTAALADSTGAVQTEYTYAPFGETSVSGPASTNPHQFTGRENDATGLYYYRARYYSPGLGRFISEDPHFRAKDSCGPALRMIAPIVAVGIDRLDVNAYVYVGNNPIRFTDRRGLQRSDDDFDPGCEPCDEPVPGCAFLFSYRALTEKVMICVYICPTKSAPENTYRVRKPCVI